MLDGLEIEYLETDIRSSQLTEVVSFLARNGLDFEEGVEIFVLIRDRKKIVACAGLESNIVKCVAIDPLYRGESIGLTVVSEVVNLAFERGHVHLFLYTRPNNIAFFAGCGFHKIVEVPGFVTLMENTPVGIRSYCKALAGLRQPGDTIGAVVMNANPFTLGHRYLVEQAAEQCDVLHLFVVAEDASFFPYAERFELVRAGIAGIPRVVLHPGSEYMISRATFSSYFFKEKNVVGDCFTAVDLLIFREYIAPALGITHRFVGTEPFCRTTNKYNADMKYWLQADLSAAAPITVVEIPRSEHGAVPISASEVRRLLAANAFEQIEKLVPPTTFAHLQSKYRNNRGGMIAANGLPLLASLEAADARRGYSR
jgi:[citrate (pro-3S)-lyase] ligase